MRTQLYQSFLVLLVGTLLVTACDNVNTSTNFEESINLFTDLEPVPGASNVTAVVNKGENVKANFGEAAGSDSWFQVKLENIGENDIMNNGTTGAWCLEWKKRLRSDNDVHEGNRIYSTSGAVKWKPMHYFFSIKNELESNDPTLTRREFQAVVWTLAGEMGIAPEFDLSKLDDSELPSRLRENGQAIVKKEKVIAIINRINSEYKTASASSYNSLAPIVMETEGDEQDLIMPDPPASNKGPFSDFTATAFDIDAVSDGSILVTQNNAIKEIRKNKVKTFTTLPTANGSPITGISHIGPGNFFAVSGRVFSNDQEAILWRVSRGNASKISDIQAFEEAQDPDASLYDPKCNNVDPFVTGPQSDPYHMTTLNGGEVLIADAAGNTLLSAKTDGSIDWVALFPPAEDENGNIPTVPVTISTEEVIDCQAQPVPTSVAVGPDGSYYVGELTGAPAVPGMSRIWRVDADAMNTVCPSEDCTLAVSGLTSVIDLTFGPDGMLYVAEYDKNGWLSVFGGAGAGGAIKKCNVSSLPTSDSDGCVVVEEAGIYPDLPLPSALTFDKRDNLWVLLDNLGTLGTPTVRKVSMP